MATLTRFSDETNIFGVLAPKSLSEMSDSEHSSFFDKFSKQNQRQNQLFGVLGGSGGKAPGRVGESGGVGGSSSSSSSSSSSGGLFGNLLGGNNSGLDALTNRAKDLANFNVGLYKDQANFDFGLRDKEAEGNFGRQFKLDTNQRQFDRNINTDTQTAMTDRLQKQLNTQLEQQSRDINQQNFATSRAINLASRRLGSRR
jgi:hypothetical protein